MKKAVFVTGASQGTGYAIAAAFAKEGYAVCITGREKETAAVTSAAESLSATYGVFAKGYQLDIRDEKRVAEIFKDIDQNALFVETVVLNAADQAYGTDPAKGLDFFGMTAEEFSRVLDTNLVWNFTIIRQAALRMRQKNKGAVVFIGSNTAYRAIPNRAAYIASKGGILSFSKALAVDLGIYGIRSNVVVPGTIKTERWEQMGSKRIVSGDFTPIGDISDFEDVANAALYLGTELSKNVTGAEIIVDGGMSCQLYPRVLTTLKQEAIERNEM